MFSKTFISHTCDQMLWFIYNQDGKKILFEIYLGYRPPGANSNFKNLEQAFKVLPAK